MPPEMLLRATGWMLAAVLLVLASLPVGASEASRNCLALLAYTEAAGEGPDGMAAVIEVVRNRVRDRRFPDGACEVGRQQGQFQPVSEDRNLMDALARPTRGRLETALGIDTDAERSVLATALSLATRPASRRTGGALYFVNPLYMDPDNCPWFAGLRRTAVIGAHVFMTEWDGHPGPRDVALDCTSPEIGRHFKDGLPRAWQIGLFDPGGPKIATRTPTPAMIRAWQKSPDMKAREAALRRRFPPGWLSGDPTQPR